MGTQKNLLNEKVLLSTQNTFKLIGKEIKAILRLKNLLNRPYDLWPGDATITDQLVAARLKDKETYNTNKQRDTQTSNNTISKAVSALFLIEIIVN